MKKTSKTCKVFALILIACIALCFVSCNTEQETEGEIVVVVAGGNTQEYTVSLDEIEVSGGVVAVLDHLESAYKLDYAMEGTMLSKVGELENDAASGEWIYIYTSVATDADVSQYATTVEYKGQTLTSSGVGVTDLHIEDGAVIYFGMISFE